MNGGTAASLDNLYTNWMPSGVWQGLLSGDYGGDLNGQGYSGAYWSSTAVVAEAAYRLSFYDVYVNSGNGNTKDVGYAVRCLI